MMPSLAPVAAEIFRVVILYDQFPSARLAAEAYSHLSREIETEFTLELRIWRVDVAISNDCAAHADNDFEIADMVILAAKDLEGRLAVSKRWTGRSGDRPRLRKQALVAISPDDLKAPVATSTWSDVLMNAFEKTQTDVFLWPSNAILSEPAPSRSAAALPGITP